MVIEVLLKHANVLIKFTAQHLHFPEMASIPRFMEPCSKAIRHKAPTPANQAQLMQVFQHCLERSFPFNFILWTISKFQRRGDGLGF